MSRKRPKFMPDNWEKQGSSNLSATIYASMMQSEAWESLSNNARVLYLYMKLQKYGAKPIDGHEPDCFYFNWAMANKTYELYTNPNQFNKDKKKLIEFGFIELVESGKNTRTKSIFKFSGKWKEFSPQ